MQRDGGFERVADDVIEVEARESFRVGESVGVDHDERAERLGLLPEWRVVRLGELAARNVGQYLSALHAERGHAALELARGLCAIAERHGAERDEEVRLAPHIYRK